MSDPFAWGDDFGSDTPDTPAPVFDGSDPLEIVRSIPAHIPVSPTSSAIRPEWSIRLVIDFVLGASKEAICEEYQLMPHHYDLVVADVGFQAKVATLKKELEKEGATFTLKAQLQAEDLIDEAYKIAKTEDMDPRVRAKLIGDIVRWAGFDKTGATVDGTGSFSLNINFAGVKPVGNTYDGEITDV